MPMSATTPPNRETFHIFVRVRETGQQRFVRMAESADAARASAEADGYVVLKVRRAPRPAGMGAPIVRRRY